MNPAYAGVAVAGLVLLCLMLYWLATPGRASVHPVKGRITYVGAPLASAMVSFHPIGRKGSTFPQPHAMAAEDGSFVVGTYGATDGAPAGEYTVTVTWFPQAKGNEGGVRGPAMTNFLPARYANSTTSGLTVRIEPGENTLPTIDLKR